MRLRNCFMELFAYGLYFKDARKKDNISIDDVQEEVSDLIAKSKQIAQENNLSNSDYDLARFAVLVWIDEIIMRSSWPEKTKWQKRFLQRQFYKTSKGGIEFYKHLKDLDHDQNEIREVFFLSMIAGFRGKYDLSDEDHFGYTNILSKNLKQLTGTTAGLSASIDERIFKEAYDNSIAGNSDSTRKIGNLPLGSAIIVYGSLFIFVFLFFLYKYILNHEMGMELVF